jgi:hypothetical protein
MDNRTVVVHITYELERKWLDGTTVDVESIAQTLSTIPEACGVLEVVTNPGGKRELYLKPGELKISGLDAAWDRCWSIESAEQAYARWKEDGKLLKRRLARLKSPLSFGTVEQRLMDALMSDPDEDLPSKRRKADIVSRPPAK